MAESCDFEGDYSNVSASSGKECAQMCRKDKECTHFTYSKDSGKLPKCSNHFITLFPSDQVVSSYHSVCHNLSPCPIHFFSVSSLLIWQFPFPKKTRPVLDRFHDSSKSVLVFPADLLKYALGITT